MLGVPGALLLCISSPCGRRGPSSIRPEETERDLAAVHFTRLRLGCGFRARPAIARGFLDCDDRLFGL